MMVPCPIVAEEAMATPEAIKGWNLRVMALKSRKGSSDINSALPSGTSTALLIRIVVAALLRALS